MSHNVTDNLINPIISSGDPLAALKDINDGGTGSIRASYKIGWRLKNNSETYVMSLAVSIVKS